MIVFSVTYCTDSDIIFCSSLIVLVALLYMFSFCYFTFACIYSTVTKIFIYAFRIDNLKEPYSL